MEISLWAHVAQKGLYSFATGQILCGAGSMRLTFPAWAHSSKPSAAGLLHWAGLAGDID